MIADHPDLAVPLVLDLDELALVELQARGPANGTVSTRVLLGLGGAPLGPDDEVIVERARSSLVARGLVAGGDEVVVDRRLVVLSAVLATAVRSVHVGLDDGHGRRSVRLVDAGPLRVLLSSVGRRRFELSFTSADGSVGELVDQFVRRLAERQPGDGRTEAPASVEVVVVAEAATPDAQDVGFRGQCRAGRLRVLDRRPPQVDAVEVLDRSALAWLVEQVVEAAASTSP